MDAFASYGSVDDSVDLSKHALSMRIYLDTHEKEQIIFETLNAPREPLTEWDKIKNYLLYKADEEQGLDQESFFDLYLA